ncbi:MAG: hypothetical protein ACTHMM_23685 [Agriterribacter sp.]
MTEKNVISRREFVSTAAAFTLPLLMSNTSGIGAANTPLRHACIGVGGMGGYDLGNFKQHPDVKIVALCDTDANILKKAAEQFPEARTYSDW